MIPFLVATFFTLEPADITASLLYVSNVFSDAKLLILLAIGVPMAFYVIKRAIGLAPKGR